MSKNVYQYTIKSYTGHDWDNFNKIVIPEKGDHIDITLDNYSNSYNLFNAFGPGLYQIVCKANKKRYIGESKNVIDRVAKHARDLVKGVSECSGLQKDWNLYGSDKFEANVICIGDEWSSHEARLKKENELICSYSPEEVYNTHPYLKKDKKENYRVICKINGTIYQSIAEASRLTNEKENKIRAKLYNKFDNYLILDKIETGNEPIIIRGIEYPSINNAIEAGEAKDRFQATRRLKSLKYKDWNYKSEEKKINKST